MNGMFATNEMKDVTELRSEMEKNLSLVQDLLETVSRREGRMSNKLLMLRAKQALDLTMKYLGDLE